MALGHVNMAAALYNKDLIEVSSEACLTCIILLSYISFLHFGLNWFQP